MKNFARFALLAGVALTPAFALAATFCVDDLCALGMDFIDFINVVLVPFIFAIAFIVFVWGMFYYYIYGATSEEYVKKGHQLILWGMIGFFVMLSLWGLVNVVANTVSLKGALAPAPPSLYKSPPPLGGGGG